MQNEVLSPEAWAEARRAFMVKEKAFQKQRDELAAERQALPWMKVEKDYRFTGPDGEVSLADLFGDKSQLFLWHFMFGADWQEGCPSCSFWADQYSPAAVHLAARDVRLVAVSTAPLATLDAYKSRMGWSFPWYSSGTSSFNRDFAVTFSEEEIASKEPIYNHETSPAFSQESPGLSVFYKGEDGSIYRTYSAYARGLDPLNAAYQHLDLVPKGRDEAAFPYPMGWLKRHDQYGA